MVRSLLTWIIVSMGRSLTSMDGILHVSKSSYMDGSLHGTNLTYMDGIFRVPKLAYMDGILRGSS